MYVHNEIIDRFNFIVAIDTWKWEKKKGKERKWNETGMKERKRKDKPWLLLIMI